MTHRHRNTLRRVLPHLPRSNQQAYYSVNGPGDALGPTYSPPVGWIVPTPVPSDITTYAYTNVLQPGSRLFYLSNIYGVAPALGVYYFWNGSNIVDNTGSTTGVGGVPYGTDPLNPTGPIIAWKHWAACGPAGNTSASLESSWSEVGIRGANITVGPVLMLDSMTKRRRSPDWWLFKRGEDFDLADDLIDYKTYATSFNTAETTLSLMGGKDWRGKQVVGAYGPLSTARPKISNRLGGAMVNRQGDSSGTADAEWKNSLYMDLDLAGYIRDPSLKDITQTLKWMGIANSACSEPSINVMFQGCLWNGCGALIPNTSSNRQGGVTVNISTGAEAVFSSTAPHNLEVGRPVRFLSTTGTLPAPFVIQSQVWVREVLSATTFTVSLRPDPTSPAITTTTAETGQHLLEILEPTGTNQVIFHRCAVIDSFAQLYDPAHVTGIYFGAGYGGGRMQLSEMFISQCGFNYGIKPSDQEERTCTISNGAPAVIGMASHDLVADNPVIFISSASPPTLPSGVTALTRYYVKTVLTADTFTVAATVGGAAINTTTAGSGTHTAVMDIKDAGSGAHSAITTIPTGTVFERNLYLGGHTRLDLCWLTDSMILRGASGEQFRGGWRLQNNFFVAGYVTQGGFNGHPDADRPPSGCTVGNWQQVHKQSPMHPGWGIDITDGHSFSTVADNVVSYAQSGVGAEYAFKLNVHSWGGSGHRYTYGLRHNKIYCNHFESGVADVVDVEDGLTTYSGSIPARMIAYVAPGVHDNEYMRNVHITTSDDSTYTYLQLAPAAASNVLVYSNNASYVSRAAAQAAIGGTDWDRTLKTYLQAQGVAVASSDGVPEITKTWIDGQWRGNWDERWTGRSVRNYCRSGREKGAVVRWAA